VITSSGYRIGPFEVESTLKVSWDGLVSRSRGLIANNYSLPQEHPAVAESAAVSSPDKARGEIVKAFIQLHPEYATTLKTDADRARLAAEIQAAFRKASAPYKVPREIEFVDDLP